MTDRTYRDQVDPIKADKTGRVIQPTTLRRQRIDLSVALVDQPFRVNGDFLYADTNSTGAATIKLNNTSEDPIPFLSQAMVEGLPIKDVFVSCAAQPGLFLNLWYGYQARIRPPLSLSDISDRASRLLGVVSVDGRTNIGTVLSGASKVLNVSEAGIFTSTSFISNAAVAAGGTLNIFAAAANPGGVVVADSELLTSSAAVNAIALLANSAAPGSVVTGVAVHAACCLAGGQNAPTRPARQIIYSGGMGFWYFSVALEAGQIYKKVHYTLL